MKGVVIDYLHCIVRREDAYGVLVFRSLKQTIHTLEQKYNYYVSIFTMCTVLVRYISKMYTYAVTIHFRNINMLTNSYPCM